MCPHTGREIDMTSDLKRLQSEVFRDTKHAATLDDYANMTRAAVSLYEATGNADYIDTARSWIATNPPPICGSAKCVDTSLPPTAAYLSPLTTLLDAFKQKNPAKNEQAKPHATTASKKGLSPGRHVQTFFDGWARENSVAHKATRPRFQTR